MAAAPVPPFLPQALNTVENVIHTAKMLQRVGGLAEVAVVTADYHMERATRIFEGIFLPLFPGLTLSPFPDPAPITAEQRAAEMRVEAIMLPKLADHIPRYCSLHGLPLPK